MLAAATVIAKHTSVLCNACKVASSKTSNPVAKRHFVQAAKEVANSTANLVKNIKVSPSPTQGEISGLGENPPIRALPPLGGSPSLVRTPH